MKHFLTDMAFPITTAEAPNNSAQFGLTKREWMAGMIACGYVANKERPQHYEPEADSDWILRLTDLILEKAQTYKE
jgi:hypothetical protein